MRGTKADQEHVRLIHNTIFVRGCINPDARPKYADGETALSYGYNGEMSTYDVSQGEFPIITLRPIAYKSAIREIFWIYQDQSNDLNLLREKYKIKWWDHWDIGDGTIGTIYGHTVKRYDLMNKLLEGLKNEPYGRRHIMSLWQNDEVDDAAMKPCAFMTIWNVRNVNGAMYLDLTLVQRSCDLILAWCINEFQYCALQHIVAHCLGYRVGIFNHFVQNMHIYLRYLSEATDLLSRPPIDCHPRLVIDGVKDFYQLTPDNVVLYDYPLETIKQCNPQFPSLQEDIAI